MQCSLWSAACLKYAGTAVKRNGRQESEQVNWHHLLHAFEYSRALEQVPDTGIDTWI